MALIIGQFPLHSVEDVEDMQTYLKGRSSGVPFSHLGLTVYRHRLRSSVSLPEFLVETCRSAKVKIHGGIITIDHKV